MAGFVKARHRLLRWSGFLSPQGTGRSGVELEVTLREPRAGTTVGADWTIPEHIDDGCVRYALDGAVVWTALAMSRALVDGQLRPGDAGFDRLVAIQRELSEIREDWP
jgi:hypothetical protein